MSSVLDKDELIAQIEATRLLLQQLEDREGVNAMMLESRIAELQHQLQQADSDVWQAKTALLFETPSYGVQVGTAGAVLPLYRDLVAKATANVGGRDLKPTGRLGHRNESELVLTQILVDPPGFEGYVGLELQEPFAQLSKSPTYVAVQETTELMRAAGAAEDSDLDEQLDNQKVRILNSIKEFFEYFSSSKQSISIISNEKRVLLGRGELESAIERVSVETVVTSEIYRLGVFRGATLDSKRFDFEIEAIPSDEFESGSVSGRIYKGVSESLISQWNKSLISENCLAKFQLKIVRGNTVRKYYTLVAVVRTDSKQAHDWVRELVDDGKLEGAVIQAFGEYDPPSQWSDDDIGVGDLDDFDDINDPDDGDDHDD